ASSSSILNSDSTMALDTLTVTLHLSIGVVAEDGRIEPGDMILQVNDISFEKLSNDDAAEILREACKTPGLIKLVAAKCWDSTPRDYFTLPCHEQARPVDPSSCHAHTQAVQNTYDNSQQQILPHNRQSLLNSKANMSSTISSTNNTMVNNERFSLDLTYMIGSDMDTFVRPMAKPASGSDLVTWLFKNVDGFLLRDDARFYASKLLKIGYIRHPFHKLQFREKSYYVFRNIYPQNISRLKLHEKSKDYESISARSSIIDGHS
ncbi:unnamed protein product, partial [Rotaria sordida]